MSTTFEQNTNSKKVSGLRGQCLSFTEVLGQSIANIAPSVGPVIGIPLVFATAGNGSWLAYLFATVAVALIGYHINHFAKRSASPGALYNFVADGLGPGAGFVSGWGLVLAYFLTACAVLAGFANYANVLAGYIGVSIPPIVLCAIGIIAAWYMTYKDINMSAKFMLIFEGVSLGLIFILGIVVLVKNGFKVDLAQFTLKDVSFDNLKIGLVLAFFSFVGFESATSLGDEAKNPLRNIPRAVIYSALFVGFIFITFSYIEVLGFIGSTEKLNEAAAPLTSLAERNGVGFLGLFISLGATVSCFACIVASITAGARILFTMGRHKIIPATFGKAHENNETPHVAVTVLSVIVFIIPAILFAFNSGLMDIFGWLGTIATLGFLLSYAMIVIAAPVFLFRRKELKFSNVIVAVISLVILLIPIVGSVYPLPPYPYSIFPFIFLGWLLLSGSWFAVINVKKGHVVADMKKEIKQNNDDFLKSKEAVSQI